MSGYGIDPEASEKWADALEEQYVRFAWIDTDGQHVRIETTDREGVENKVYISVVDGKLQVEY